MSCNYIWKNIISVIRHLNNGLNNWNLSSKPKKLKVNLGKEKARYLRLTIMSEKFYWRCNYGVGSGKSHSMCFNQIHGISIKYKYKSDTKNKIALFWQITNPFWFDEHYSINLNWYWIIECEIISAFIIDHKLTHLQQTFQVFDLVHHQMYFKKEIK